MIILFGGSFDPVHIGHIILARDALEILNAQKVLFMPAYRAPLKENHFAPAGDRLNMLRLALEGAERFEVDDYEIKKEGVSYTVDTLLYLKDRLGTKPYLLLGADSVLRLHLWKEPERVLSLARLLVVDRDGKLEKALLYLKESFGLREGSDYIVLKTRRIDISSTEIRERVKEGKSIFCLVPDVVLKYIEEKKLYL